MSIKIKPQNINGDITNNIIKDNLIRSISINASITKGTKTELLHDDTDVIISTRKPTEEPITTTTKLQESQYHVDYYNIKNTLGFDICTLNYNSAYKNESSWGNAKITTYKKIYMLQKSISTDWASFYTNLLFDVYAMRDSSTEEKDPKISYEEVTTESETYKNNIGGSIKIYQTLNDLKKDWFKPNSSDFAFEPNYNVGISLDNHTMYLCFCTWAQTTISPIDTSISTKTYIYKTAYTRVDLGIYVYSLSISNENQQIGNNENSFIYDSSDLLQVGTTTNNEVTYRKIANNVINEWKNGKETITKLKCSLSDYYDTNGNLVISTSEPNVPMTFNIGDIVEVYITKMRTNNQGNIEPYEDSISFKQDGTPTQYRVTNVSFDFKGSYWQYLDLQEVTT